MPHHVASDLGLHCLPMFLLWDLGINGLMPHLYVDLISQIRYIELLGPEYLIFNCGYIISGISLREINPCHLYLGCLPSFSAYNRCMMCHNCGMDGPVCEGNLENGATSW